MLQIRHKQNAPTVRQGRYSARGGDPTALCGPVGFTGYGDLTLARGAVPRIAGAGALRRTPSGFPVAVLGLAPAAHSQAPHVPGPERFAAPYADPPPDMAHNPCGVVVVVQYSLARFAPIPCPRGRFGEPVHIRAHGRGFHSGAGFGLPATPRAALGPLLHPLHCGLRVVCLPPL